MARIQRGFVRTKHGDVLVRYGGRGRPVVLLHHTHGSSESAMRDNFLPNLADSCFVIAPDLLGQGESAHPERALHIEDFAENIIEIVTELGFHDAEFIGHHTGAAVALEIAAGDPDRVGKLIFSGLPIYTAEERAQKLLNASFQPWQIDDSGTYLETLWKKRMGVTDGLTAEQMHWQFLEFLRAGPRGNEPVRALFQYDALARLPEVQAKTLALAALSDNFGARIDEVVKRIPGAETAIVADGTLFYALDSDAFLATVLDFFELG